jgi:uncharacterized protein YbaR (Trm112 family)
LRNGESKHNVIENIEAYKTRRRALQTQLEFVYMGRTGSFRELACPLCGTKYPIARFNLHEIVNRPRLSKTELWNLPQALHVLICWQCNTNQNELKADSTEARLRLLMWNIEIYGRDTILEALLYCDGTVKVGEQTGLLRRERDVWELIHQSDAEEMLRELY